MGKTLLIRGYIQYLGDGRLAHEAPENIEQYITNNTKLDLVICYRSEKYNEEDWTSSIEKSSKDSMADFIPYRSLKNQI